MADFFEYADDVLEAEGGFVNHPNDPGGATNRGITLNVWQRYGSDNDDDGDIDVDDLKLLTESQALQVYKERYWDAVWGDRINDQALAEIIFDHAVNAGVWRAVKMTQFLLKFKFGKNLDDDGRMGRNTLSAINSVNAARLYNQYIDLRKDYYNYRANRLSAVRPDYMSFLPTLRLSPSNSARAFIEGWLNRVSEFAKKKH